MQLLIQAMRSTLRDWRSGELRLLVAALIVAVASVSSVGFFVDRIRAALVRDAAQLIGGDVVVSSDNPIADKFLAQAKAQGLRTTQTVTFPSMAVTVPDPALATTSQAAVSSQLVSAKAVQDGYPLRGAVRVSTTSTGADEAATGGPPRGAVWVDPQLLGMLNVKVGQPLRLGDLVFKVDRVITIEPDRGTNFVNVAPRVMFNYADLAATGLIQPGSRVNYRLLVAEGGVNLTGIAKQYGTWAKQNLGRGQRIESVESGRPEYQQTLARAEQFLSLTSLLAALIASVAIGLASRRFVERHLDGFAVMRCLGAGRMQVELMLLIEFLAIAIAASAVGAVLGWFAHYALVVMLGSFVAAQLPAPTWVPIVQGFACGVVLLVGFGLPTLLQLSRVPPARVLRREMGPPSAGVLWGYAFAVATFCGLLLWFSGDVKLGAITAGGFLVGTVLFAGIVALALRSLRPMRNVSRVGVVWRFALAALARRGATTVAQTVAISVGLMALLLLGIVRTDLVSGWRNSVPPDAPNRFVLNIQPEQQPLVKERLIQAGVKSPDLYPMIRGRLISINQQPVKPENYQEDRAKRLLDREFNLSYMTDLPSHNKVKAGAWNNPQSNDVSMEEGIMQTLGLKLGDVLEWEVAGQRFTAKIASVRTVNWDSLKVNFFAIMTPQTLRDMPQSWITSLHVPVSAGDRVNALVGEFPNLTVVDTGNIARQVQAVLDQVITAVQFVFLFTLLSGALVLYAALASSRDERMKEAALMRALGASSQQLQQAQWVELATTGALAGLLAAIGASAVAWALAKYAFQFAWVASPWVPLTGLAIGIATAMIGGWMGLRGVIKQPPLLSLRQA